MISWLRSWIRDRSGNRRVLWPIRLKWGQFPHWFERHGWPVGSERCNYTAWGYMPGWRGVNGQTLHLGKLKVMFGKPWPDGVRHCDMKAAMNLGLAAWGEAQRDGKEQNPKAAEAMKVFLGESESPP
jgi:hypothetical protein